MEVQILLFIDVNEKIVSHESKKRGDECVGIEEVQRLAGEAIKNSISNILHDQFLDTPGVKLTLAVADIAPISDTCTVRKGRDGTILLHGDKDLCKNLQETIGPNIAKIMPTI